MEQKLVGERISSADVSRQQEGLRFPKILTISMNPVADLTFYVDEFLYGEDNVVTGELYDAAGKSVDVSRVLKGYGVDNTAVVLAGKENSARYFQRLADENVDTRVIYVPGRIRENISIITGKGKMTRLMRQGPKISAGAMNALTETLLEELEPHTLVVMAGRLPDGVTPAMLADLCEWIQQKGGVVALDTNSVSIDVVEQIKPWVMKPNHQELEMLLGHTTRTQSERKAGVLELHRRGVRHVLASFGEEGMLYTDGKQTLRAVVPALSEIKSTVGAGDAALAGFLIAQDYRYTAKESLSMAAAFGTAACLVEGTNPPRRISVAMIKNQVQVFAV